MAIQGEGRKAQIYERRTRRDHAQPPTALKVFIQATGKNKEEERQRKRKCTERAKQNRKAARIK